LVQQGEAKNIYASFPLLKGRKKVRSVPAVAWDLFHCHNAQLTEENMSQLKKLTSVVKNKNKS